MPPHLNPLPHRGEEIKRSPFSIGIFLVPSPLWGEG
jgi:hypothetical protein